MNRSSSGAGSSREGERRRRNSRSSMPPPPGQIALPALDRGQPELISPRAPASPAAYPVSQSGSNDSLFSLSAPLLPNGQRRVPKQRQRFILYTPFSSAVSESSSFPHDTRCMHCSRQLRAGEARWGTGLCDPCYGNVDKTCQSCHTRLALQQLHWNSGLCNRCFDSCETNCRLCDSRLDLKTQAVRGICDPCSTGFEHNCRECAAKLDVQMLKWGSGLCNRCYDKSDKTCKSCSTQLVPTQLRWGTGLCDYCYESAEKACTVCAKTIDLGQLHWGTGLCDECFDSFDKSCRHCNKRLDVGQLRWGTGLCDECWGFSREDASKRDAVGAKRAPLSAGVQTVISAQFVFYLAPSILLPSLYLQIEAAGWPNASRTYAAVLTTTTVVSMALPVPLGIWAERCGERHVYVGLTLIATMAAVVLAFGANSGVVFALGWATLSAPISLRGVRAAYFARTVPPEELSRVGQLASAAGLVGSVLGPLLAAVAQNLPWFGLQQRFAVEAAFAGLAHAACAVALLVWMPPRAPPRKSAAGTDTPGQRRRPVKCEKCRTELNLSERRWGTALCDGCWDSWFRHYKRRVLVAFCGIAALLEVSMNAAVVATFQPIAVSNFGWGSDQIAAVNFLSSSLSIVVSLTMAQLRLPERGQASVASLLYLGSVLVYTASPLSEWRLVLGLVLGLKAQILFMAPFTAAFSRLMGGTRVTNSLTTALCLAPLIGAAVGTAFAPLLLAVAGTPWFMLSAMPAAFAVAGIMLGWQRLEVAQTGGTTSSASRSASTEIAPLTAAAISARALPSNGTALLVPPSSTSLIVRGLGGPASPLSR